MIGSLAADLDIPLSSIIPLYRECGVRTLDAFRSDVHGDDTVRPDWSFYVVFDESDQRRLAPRWVRLEDGLEEFLGRPVEVTGSTALENPYLRREVARGGHRIFPPFSPINATCMLEFLPHPS